jgi:hypothetical protein
MHLSPLDLRKLTTPVPTSITVGWTYSGLVLDTAPPEFYRALAQPRKLA